MEVEPWVEVVKSVGFPIGAFLLLFFSVRKAVYWVGEKVVQPAVTAHVELVGTLQRSVEDNTTSNAKTSESVRKLSEAYEEQTQLLKQIAKTQTVVPQA